MPRLAPLIAAWFVARVAATAAADPEPEAEAGASAGVAVLGGAATDGASAGAVAWIEGEAVYEYNGTFGGRTSSYARGDAEARARAGTSGLDLTIEQRGEARPWGYELFQFTLAERLDLNAAPRLSDRPDRWRRRFHRAGFDVDVICLGLRYGPVGIQYIRLENGFDWERQRDDADGATSRRFVMTSNWSPLAINLIRGGRETGRLDLGAVEATSIDGASDGVVITYFSPRLTGLELGPVTLDAAYGGAATGWSQIRVDDEPVRTITSEDLPVILTPAWRGRLSVRADRFDAAISAARNLHLTSDAALVLETRATAELSTRADDTDVTVSAFAARSRIWTSPSDATDHDTGGVAVAIARPVRGDWRLDGRVELARTFYASTELDRALRVDTALQLDVGLRKQLRNWVPRGGRVSPRQNL